MSCKKECLALTVPSPPLPLPLPQGPAPAGEVNEYERQRLERIQRNKQIWDEIRARGCLPAQ